MNQQRTLLLIAVPSHRASAALAIVNRQATTTSQGG